jgi:hypothetical protein
LSLTEDEVRSVIANLPNDKAPGPDGFTGLFYKKAWGTIKMDVMNAFNAFWLLDFRSFNHLNDAYMILLKKKEHPAEIRDYRPISLMAHTQFQQAHHQVLGKQASRRSGCSRPAQPERFHQRTSHP